jgi:tetratricopeptide (TPR) repeat protein
VIILTTCNKFADAQIVIDKLDRLPLALTQAGAYLRETNISVASYIKHYDNTWKDLMEEQGRYPLQEYGNCSILTTWMISYEQVASKSEGAANLLKLWGFLDREDLWYDLLASVKEFEEDSGVPEWLVMLVESEIKFNRVISLLRRFSLIEASGPRSGSYAIHTVLHTWCRHFSSNDEQKIMLLLVIRIVAKALPLRSETAYWKLQRRLLPHGLHILANLGALQERRYQYSSTEDDIPAWIWHDFGNLFFAQVKLAEADMMFKRALAGREKALGAEHTSTLLTINNMGLLYSAQGKLPEAERMHKRALAGYEKALGPEHTDTLSAVNNLGGLYHAQGKLPEAEAMWKRALAGCEKALGPEHTNTLCTVSNLGLLYSAQGKLPEAGAMHKRALAGYEKALGPEHTETLRIVNNLGLLHSAQGELAEEEAMCKRALAGYEKALGPEHTFTLLAVNNLGGLYHAQDKLPEAEAMWRRALVGYEKALGPEHTDTLRTVTNLGLLYSAQGKLADAEAMYTRALVGYERALGAEHTHTLDTVHDLGALYRKRHYLHILAINQSRLRWSTLPPSGDRSAWFILATTRLWMKWGQVPGRLMDHIGHMLLLVGRLQDAVVAFEQRIIIYQERLVHSDVFCDGCGERIQLPSVRYVCRSCEDVDLCPACHQNYELEERLDNDTLTCRDHHFLAVPRDNWPTLPSGAVLADGTVVEEWMDRLLVSLGGTCCVEDSAGSTSI